MDVERSTIPEEAFKQELAFWKTYLSTPSGKMNNSNLSGAFMLLKTVSDGVHEVWRC